MQWLQQQEEELKVAAINSMKGMLKSSILQYIKYVNTDDDNRICIFGTKIDKRLLKCS